MPLTNLVIVLGVVAVILWVINSYIPMPSIMKGILNVIVIVALILWLLNGFGVLGSFFGLRTGK